jgi:hypothetical protein
MTIIIILIIILITCSLGSMDTKWFKLLPDTRSTILDALYESMLGLTPQGVANSLYGFGLMGTMYNNECYANDASIIVLVSSPSVSILSSQHNSFSI